MTPLMQQYQDVKSLHPDSILFFRMGDFYEMFNEDAVLAAPLLGIALTARNKKAQDHTPMCGVPHHAAGSAISRLIALGHRVALCDQLEDPKQAKKEGRAIVRRGVTRIFSPGMVFDAETLLPSQSSYIAAVSSQLSNLGGVELALVDTSTGETFVFRSHSSLRLQAALASVGCAELILTDVAKKETLWTQWLLRHGIPHRSLGFSQFTFATGQTLDELEETNRKALTAELKRICRKEEACFTDSLGLALALVLSQMTPEAACVWLRAAIPCQVRELQESLGFGPAVFKHLELFENAKGEEKGSLFGVINRTVTGGGARLLRRWLQFPPCDLQLISERQERIGIWMKAPGLRREIRSAVSSMGDLRRKLMKLSGTGFGPMDLRHIQRSLKIAIHAVRTVQPFEKRAASGERLDTEALDSLALTELESLSQEIDRILVDEPPLKNGALGAIRKGVIERLDQAMDRSTRATRALTAYEVEERARTGIPSLKIRYNGVYGYSIEVTNTHREKVPTERYTRKQTLTQAERYTTAELMELENELIEAEEARASIESDLIRELTEQTLKMSSQINRLAQVVDDIDAVTSLAEVAESERWTCPILKPVESQDAPSILIRGSRHPAVEYSLRERSVGASAFIKNDIDIRPGQCILLTGPNMAGKSTLMRQVAVTAILAQIGSYVPADSAELPIFKHIATRIGAHDSLSEGLSTFMIEMQETASLLQSAGPGTLLLLDEIGRGTATFDGLSLAQAILESLLKRGHGFTLFATHYHELAQLEANYPNLINAHLAVTVDESDRPKGHSTQPLIRFLYLLRKGPATRSYGIEVARLAGLPKEITRRAEVILRDLEGRLSSGQLSLLSLSNAIDQEVVNPVQNDREPAVGELLQALEQIDVNQLTPLAALNAIQELKDKVCGTVASASS